MMYKTFVNAVQLELQLTVVEINPATFGKLSVRDSPGFKSGVWAPEVDIENGCLSWAMEIGIKAPVG